MHALGIRLIRGGMETLIRSGTETHGKIMKQNNGKKENLPDV